MLTLVSKESRPRLTSDAERGLGDLFFFGPFFLDLDLRERPHREMCDAFQANDDDDATPGALIEVPRGCYKTTIMRANMIRKQLRQIFLFDNPYHRIVLMSATLKLSNMSLAVIEQTLRYNRKLNESYGELWVNRSRGGAGSKNDFGISHGYRVRAGPKASIAEPSFWVGSIQSASTGLHADEGGFDDLNNKKNTRTAHQRALVQETYELIYPLIGSEVGKPAKITMSCTPWHDDDVRGRIKRDEKQKAELEDGYVPSWTILHRSAINPDGTAYFEEKLPLALLEKLRQSISVNEFAANYLTDPVGDRGFVDSEAIIFKARKVFPSLRDGRITVDPNHHKEAKELGCYAAIVVGAYDRFANLWILDARGAREWTTLDIIEQLFDVQELFPAYPIFMEDSHMGHFSHAVSMEEARRSEKAGARVHLRINYIPVDVNTTKVERWERLQPRFARRGCYFSDEIAPKIKAEIREELERGAAARFNDFLDALANQETGARPRLNKDGSFRDINQPMVPGQKEKAPEGLNAGDFFPDFRRLM